jgi:hypothetical protein
MNSDKRMAELYLERAAGKKHLWFDDIEGEWVECSCDDDFYYNGEYKLKPETLDEFIEREVDSEYMYSGRDRRKLLMRKVAQWAWANPESKE